MTYTEWHLKHKLGSFRDNSRRRTLSTTPRTRNLGTFHVSLTWSSTFPTTMHSGKRESPSCYKHSGVLLKRAETHSFLPVWVSRLEVALAETHSFLPVWVSRLEVALAETHSFLPRGLTRAIPFSWTKNVAKVMTSSLIHRWKANTNVLSVFWGSENQSRLHVGTDSVKAA